MKMRDVNTIHQKNKCNAEVRILLYLLISSLYKKESQNRLFLTLCLSRTSTLRMFKLMDDIFIFSFIFYRHHFYSFHLFGSWER